MTADCSVIASPGGDTLLTASPGDDLIQRLDDPQIAASLSVILDHAELLATLITGLDGLVQRAEVIGDSLTSGVAEIRGVAASGNGSRPWPKVDVAALSESATRLSAAVVEATPVLAEVGEALVAGRQAAAADPRGPRGFFALMRATKDPDVSRGLGFMIQIARAFGRRLAPEPPPKKERTPRHAAA